MTKMTKITYVTGDATQPIGDGKKIIVHICNDCKPGAWGSGFVIALSHRWKAPEQEYRKWSKQGRWNQIPYRLGSVQSIPVEDDIIVVNMIGQKDIHPHNGIPPVRYGAIRKCLRKVAKTAQKHGATIHAPKFGSDRAGGDWNTIEQIINEELCAKNVPVVVYNFKP